MRFGATGRLRHRALAFSALVSVLVSSSVYADAIPSDIQAELLAKLENYDRNFAGRAGSVARVLLLVKSGSTKSTLAAEEMKSALSRLPKIGGLPHEETIVSYDGAAALAARCKRDHVAVVYVTPGFDPDIGDVRAALTSVDVLSLAAISDYVSEGIILGFELEAGAPKILFNLTQARQQHIDFPADLLRLMKVFR